MEENQLIGNGLNQVVDVVKEVSATKEEVDLAEVGLQLTDVIISSGIIEQFGTELGVSGAIIAAILGAYWKFRGGKPKQAENHESPKQTPIESSSESAKEEISQLKSLEEQQKKD